MKLAAMARELPSWLERWLSEHASKEQLAVADRIARAAGVVQLSGALPLYRVAALAIARFRDSVDVDLPALLDTEPLHNPELWWRLQIMVDVLLRRSGRTSAASGAAAFRS